MKIGRFIPFGLKNGIRHLQFKRKYPSVYLGQGVEVDVSTTTVGEGCSINAYTRISHSVVGRYTYTARNCNVMNVKLGSFCSIGPGCQIGLGNHPSHFISTSPIFYSTAGQLNGETWVDQDYYEEFSPVTIRDNVWLGAHAIVLDGVTIGEGAIVAAGAVVTKDVPPYAIAAGVPAKVIRYRFREETIKKILDMQIFSRKDKWLKEWMTGEVTPDDLLLGRSKEQRKEAMK
nr:CatB-related O-acetyltransferase [Halobacillus kuroshimensis]